MQLLILRFVVRGFIQSLLIQNYNNQIIVLCITDLIFIFFVICFKIQFLHKIVFNSMLLHNVLFLILDTLLAVRYYYCNLILSVVLWSIVIIYLILFISILFIGLKKFGVVQKKMTLRINQPILKLKKE